jgi:hypothetical protein
MASNFEQFLEEARDLTRLMNEIKDEIKLGKREALDESDADHVTQKKPKSNEEGGDGPGKTEETLTGAAVEPVSPAMSTDERGSERGWSLYGGSSGSQSDDDYHPPKTPKTP